MTKWTPDAKGLAIALVGPVGSFAGRTDMLWLQVPLVRHGEPVSSSTWPRRRRITEALWPSSAPNTSTSQTGRRLSPAGFALRLGNERP